MEMADLTAPLVLPPPRGTIHHRRNYDNDLPVQRRRWGESYSLNLRDCRDLTNTINECKPHTSWSTTLRFAFSWENPLLSPFLQRAANLSVITFSYFSGVLPFSSKIITGVSTALEGIQWGEHCYRGWGDHWKSWLFAPLPFVSGFMCTTYLWPGWDRDSNDLLADTYSFLMLSLFQTLFVANCLFTYFADKTEYDLKLQLENLRQILKEHPELETHLALLHNDTAAEDNAFVDPNGKPLLFPFYQVIQGDAGSKRLYLTPDEFHMLLTKKTDPLPVIYCDKARFEKVLMIFKNVQTSNV